MARPEEHFQRFGSIEEANKPAPVRQDPAVGRHNGIQNMAPLMRSYKTKVDGLFAMIDWDVWKTTGESWLEDPDGNPAEGVEELAQSLYQVWGDAYDRLLIAC